MALKSYMTHCHTAVLFYQLQFQLVIYLAYGEFSEITCARDSYEYIYLPVMAAQK